MVEDVTGKLPGFFLRILSAVLHTVMDDLGQLLSGIDNIFVMPLTFGLGIER